MRTVSFQVQAIPPYKQSPADATERQHQLHRKDILQSKAREVFGNSEIVASDCSVGIRYSRHMGKADGANIIGGVLDCLQGIIIANDKQVIEISYAELEGKIDWYQVTVTEVAQ